MYCLLVNIFLHSEAILKIGLDFVITSLVDGIACITFFVTLRRVFKLMLTTWRSRPIKYRIRERQPIIEGSSEEVKLNSSKVREWTVIYETGWYKRA